MVKTQENTNFILYTITNLINNKKYVGYTTRTIEKRWKQHFNAAYKYNNDKHLYNAMRKYGVENFLFKEECRVSSLEELKELEIFIISELDTYKNGYNNTLGGDGMCGFSHSEKTKLKMSKKVYTAEQRQRMSESRKGIVFSEETKLKMSISATGRKQTIETIQKVIKANTGNKYCAKSILDTLTGITYFSLKECAKSLGINESTFRVRMYRNTKNFNHRFVYIE
jgi:group I intron endonuclease